MARILEVLGGIMSNKLQPQWRDRIVLIDSGMVVDTLEPSRIT